MFKGAITALITPFKDGQVDEQAYQDFIEWQISEGIHGLVPCGTTGESPTLDHDEHNRVVTLCVEAAKGRVPVIAGAGSNSTDEAIMMAKHAKEVGADGVLVATPYYNKPTPAGVMAHYKAIHDVVDLPMVLYNIPGRSVIDMTDATIAELAKLPNVVGNKDATGDLARVSTLRQLVDDSFCQISGEDLTAVAFNAQGGVGCISVTSNIAPKQVAEVQAKCLEGDFITALKLHDALVPVHQAMFCETSPGPAKYAASLKKLCRDELRLPLVHPTTDHQALIEDRLDKAGLL